MARWSSVLRNLWRWAVVLCGVGALVILQMYAISAEYKKLTLAMSLQPPMLTFQELEQVEYFTPKNPQTISLIDEFLNEYSPARRMFFPSPYDGRLYPRDTEINTTNHFYLPEFMWYDTAGNPINAYGGGVLFDHKSHTYFWYGEYKYGPIYNDEGTATTRADMVGVTCYSSKDLWAWKFEGLALAAERSDADHDLYKLNVLERPKVIYNDEDGKYVMWMHIDNATYTKAAVGVAVSDSPTGPFNYLRSFRPNGFDSRDMTVFKDDDGKAYLIYAAVDNKEIHISPLSEDFLSVTNVTGRALIGMHRVAPAMFKHRGVYYMVTSGCSGWQPNEALVHEAETVFGPWETIGNPCVGANKEYRAATFFSQGSFVLPMPDGDEGGRGMFIFMADRWNPDNFGDSRNLWLPLTVKPRLENERITPLPLWSRVSIFWHGRWRLPIKDNGETYYVTKRPIQYGGDL